jgi:UDPglucose--hexose-1-phosphate uridylyltransferase
VIRRVLNALHQHLGNPDYNFLICTAPFKDANEGFYHWHMEILPRLSTTAGFELGSGIFITTALPEQTARFFSDILRKKGRRG